MIPPELIGTIPGWITSFAMVTVLGLLLRHRAALRGLSKAESADIRKHLAEELDRVIKRQRECEEREAELRARLGKAEDEIVGLKRQIGRYSTDQVMQLGGDVPDDIRAAAERVDKIYKDRE